MLLQPELRYFFEEHGRGVLKGVDKAVFDSDLCYFDSALRYCDLVRAAYICPLSGIVALKACCCSHEHMFALSAWTCARRSIALLAYSTSLPN